MTRRAPAWHRYVADPAVWRLFAVIAADEARHAELAWAIDAWLMEQLDAGERAAGHGWWS